MAREHGLPVIVRNGFNGAAPARARNEFGDVGMQINRRALQRGRARAGAECEWRSTVGAESRGFNGAAPARARNAVKLDGPLRLPFGFNGAAPARARNAILPPHPFGAAQGFNGAAPARARNEKQHPRGTCKGILASTGPRPRGRGMTMNVGVSARPVCMLQRGRARAGAECGEFGNRQTLLNNCFNGAAPARARNVVAMTSLPFQLELLQRGRARAGAEWS